jgi:glycosyltransferase involved in cell wall biosynthesis
VLVFVMPFASPASVRHAQKLLDCLVPISSLTGVIVDARVDVTRYGGRASRATTVPSLHYLSDRRPLSWSLLLWLTKLFVIWLRCLTAIVAHRKTYRYLVCFLGSYHAPLLLIARVAGLKTILFEPGTDVVLARQGYRGLAGSVAVSLLSAAQRSMRRLANTWVVESPNVVAQMGVVTTRARIRVANLYVDMSAYSGALPPSERSRVVAFVGRLATGKRVVEFLEAARLLRDARIHFEIVGDGPLRDIVDRALDSSDLRHVERHTWLSESELARRLQLYKLLVLPSDAEGLPNTLLEAMAARTPVLASGVGAIPDVVTHGVSGFILSEPTAAAIAAAIGAAIDRDDLDVIAEHARRQVRDRYSRSASQGRWDAILRELA